MGRNSLELTKTRSPDILEDTSNQNTFALNNCNNVETDISDIYIYIYILEEVTPA